MQSSFEQEQRRLTVVIQIIQRAHRRSAARTPQNVKGAASEFQNTIVGGEKQALTGPDCTGSAFGRQGKSFPVPVLAIVLFDFIKQRKEQVPLINFKGTVAARTRRDSRYIYD